MLGVKFTSKVILRMFRIQGVRLGNVQTSRVSIIKLSIYDKTRLIDSVHINIEGGATTDERP